MRLMNFLFGPLPRGIKRTDVDGLVVSTVDTPDCGRETAIMDRKGAYPVERYKTEEEALEGHEKWCTEIIGKDKVYRLPWGDHGEITEITLERQ